MWLINSTGPDSAFESPAVLLELVSGLAQLIMQEFTQALHPGGGGALVLVSVHMCFVSPQPLSER